MMRVSVFTAAFDPQRELAGFAPDGAGAVASFIGLCRARSQDRPVERLELEHYPGFTEAELTRLAEETLREHDLIDLLVVHRVGAIAPGDAIVLVAAASAHRAPAFAAVEQLMHALKTEAPIWKREIGPEGARWIEPTEADYDARGRKA